MIPEKRLSGELKIVVILADYFAKLQNYGINFLSRKKGFASYILCIINKHIYKYLSKYNTMEENVKV